MMRLSVSTITLMLSVSASGANVVSVSFLGGRFDPGYAAGYVDAVFAPNTLGVFGSVADPGTAVVFNRPLISPGPIDLTIDSPIYGDVSLSFTALASFVVNRAGEFFTMAGSGGFISVNLVAPGSGISSFGFTGIGDYTPATPPPPPPCLDCNPPPPCLTCGPPPIAAPETSTWLMMLIGFAALSVPALMRKRFARL